MTNFLTKFRQNFTLKKWAKITLLFLSVVAVLGLGVAFALQIYAKDEVFSAKLSFHGREDWKNPTNALGEMEFSYKARINFTHLKPLLRSRTIANIDIATLSWDKKIDSSKITSAHTQNRYLVFTSPQSPEFFANLEDKRLGNLDYKIDFSPFFKTILQYYFMGVLLVFLLSNLALIKSKKAQKLATFFGLFALILSLAFTSSLTLFSPHFTIYTDSSVFNYIGQAILRGEMPYRDAIDHKGPLLYLINAAGNFITPLRGVWILECLTLILSVIFAYKTARIFLSHLMSFCAVLLSFIYYFSCLEGGNLTEQYALCFLFVSLFIFARYFRGIYARKSPKLAKFSFALCGFCFGCVCLLRLNMIALWAVFVAVIFFLELKKREFIFAKFFTLGFLVIILPIFAWLYLGGAFLDFIQWYLLFNFNYGTSGAFSSRLDIFVKFALNPLMCLSAAMVLFRALRHKNVFDFAFLGFMVLDILGVCMSGRGYGHYFLVFLPIYLYGSIAFFELLREFSKEKSVQIITLTLFLGLLFLAPFAKNFKNSLNIISKNEFLPTLKVQKDYENLALLIEKYSSNNDKISVFWNEVVIYLLSNRLSASKYVYQSQLMLIDNKNFKAYLDDLKQKKPKIIYISKHSNKEQIATLKLNELGYKEIKPNFFVYFDGQVD